MYATGGNFMRDLARSRAGQAGGKLLAAFKSAARTGRELFAGLRCPTCQAPAVLYSARSGEMKCKRGHVTGGKAKAPARAVSGAAPVAAPRAKREPLPGNVAHVMLRGVMGRDPVKGSTALGFNRDLDEARAAGARAVVVHVGSDGGDLAEADAMALHLQALAHLGVASVASVTNASSAASVVALACSYSVTTPGGRWFLHNPHLGDAPATPENLAGLDAPRERLHAFYRARTVLGASELVGVLGTEWGTFDASAALAKGLTDEVGDELRAVQVARDAAAGKGLPESPRRLALASRLQGAA